MSDFVTDNFLTHRILTISFSQDALIARFLDKKSKIRVEGLDGNEVLLMRPYTILSVVIL